ncbi:alpha/beta hydrolase [Actinocrispum wychmicini]|nr:alpha/beta hydrolase [Actinocrispum wychmicini]
MAVELPATPSVASRLLARLMAASLRTLGGVVKPGSTPLRIVREAFDAIGRTPLPLGTKIKKTEDGDLWIAAKDAAEDGVLLYLHGGGFVCGSPRTHRQLAARISASTGLPVLLLDYRLAPEHPFPAAAEDALAAYRRLLGSYAPERIVVGGDSAGGHLTACLLADIARERLPMPGAAIMLSPFLDLTGSELADRDAAFRDPFVPPEYALWCGKAYAGPTLLTHHRLDVLTVRKHGWPPVLIQVGDTECLLGDSERMARSLRRAGGYCDLQVWPGQVHVFHWFAPLLPEANAAIKQIGEFVRAVSGQTVAA